MIEKWLLSFWSQYDIIMIRCSVWEATLRWLHVHIVTWIIDTNQATYYKHLTIYCTSVPQIFNNTHTAADCFFVFIFHRVLKL